MEKPSFIQPPNIAPWRARKERSLPTIIFQGLCYPSWVYSLWNLWGAKTFHTEEPQTRKTSNMQWLRSTWLMTDHWDDRKHHGMIEIPWSREYIYHHVKITLGHEHEKCITHNDTWYLIQHSRVIVQNICNVLIIYVAAQILWATYAFRKIYQRRSLVNQREKVVTAHSWESFYLNMYTNTHQLHINILSWVVLIRFYLGQVLKKKI